MADSPDREGKSLEENVSQIREQWKDMGELIEQIERGLKDLGDIRTRISQHESRHDAKPAS